MVKYKDPYDYEQKVADKIVGGKRSIASGATFGDMDVQSPTALIDCKLVEKGNYYKVDRRVLNKVIDKATVDQLACLFVHFNESGQGIAIMREDDAVAFINGMAEE